MSADLSNRDEEHVKKEDSADTRIEFQSQFSEVFEGVQNPQFSPETVDSPKNNFQFGQQNSLEDSTKDKIQLHTLATEDSTKNKYHFGQQSSLEDNTKDKIQQRTPATPASSPATPALENGPKNIKVVQFGQQSSLENNTNNKFQFGQQASLEDGTKNKPSYIHQTSAIEVKMRPHTTLQPTRNTVAQSQFIGDKVLTPIYNDKVRANKIINILVGGVVLIILIIVIVISFTVLGK